MECTERLVFTMSQDGFILEGAVFTPTGGGCTSMPVVWVHGLASHFNTPPIVALGRQLAGRGRSFVSTNNRGHDFGTLLYSPQGTMSLAGSGWEAFSECPHDISAWVAFAAKIGPGGVVLAGHSLGALKVGYYLGQSQDVRVKGLIVASAPSTAHRQAPDLVALAESMVAEGRGRALLPAGPSGATIDTVSARTLLDRARTGIDAYGFDSADAPVTRITCPILALYGTKEMAIGGPEALETIRRNATASPRVETRMIEGADHSYYGHEGEIAATIAEWVDSLA